MKDPDPQNPLGLYILDDLGLPIEEPNLLRWGLCMRLDRQVADATLKGVRISTVFLGIDHNYGEGPPILFETMIFGGEHDGYQYRYATRTEALMGHLRAFRLVQRSQRR